MSTNVQRNCGTRVRQALKKGILARPLACESCGRVPPRTSNGRCGLQGHHPDYSKPLDVIWLCAKCHNKLGKPENGIYDFGYYERMRNDPNKNLYSVGEAAEQLDVSYSRLYRTLREDRQKETRRVGGQRILAESELPEILTLLVARRKRDLKLRGRQDE